MNDKDIIKVLRCCEDGFCYAGNGCPLGHIGDGDACITELCKNALDLINRQKAEIERLEAYNANLKAANSDITNTLWDEVVKAKTDAIKEFARLVKEHLDDFYHTDDGSLLDTVSMVDLLVEEMTEGEDGNL